MNKCMTKPKFKGYTIEIELSEECGYSGYSVECTYKYIKSKNKYSLSMWLKRNDIDSKFKVDSEKIDTQFISGTRETIVENICRIIEYASLSGYFDYYINQYDYTYQCFDRGDELFSQERLSQSDDNKE